MAEIPKRPRLERKLSADWRPSKSIQARKDAALHWDAEQLRRYAENHPGEDAVEAMEAQKRAHAGTVAEQIERVLKDAGSEGITRAQLRERFPYVGKERFPAELDSLCDAGLSVERKEDRPNAAGRMQEQVVIYSVSALPVVGDA